MRNILLIILLISGLSKNEGFCQDKDSIYLLAPVTVTSTTMVNKAVDKSFKSSFPKATNLRWYRENKDYLAKFIIDDMNHNALYKKDGFLKYDIAYGYENNLPPDVRDQVQSTYREYKISRAFNVKFGSRNIWLVNLESVKNYIKVRVEDGNLEEVERMKRSP